MGIVNGRIFSGNRPLRNLLVEAFDVTDDFARRLPFAGHHEIPARCTRRLGSATTDEDGTFAITYSKPVPLFPWTGVAPVNLWLSVTACCGEEGARDLVHQEAAVREGAAETETYFICLPANYEDASNPIQPSVQSPVPEDVVTAYVEETAFLEKERTVAEDRFQKKLAVKSEFRKLYSDKLTKMLSVVERDAFDAPIDPQFIEHDAPVRSEAEARLVGAVRDKFHTKLADDAKLSLHGRISLSDTELTKLRAARLDGVENGDGAFIVDEETLHKTLKENGDGLNPETNSPIVNRVNAVVRFCQEKSIDDLCQDAPAPGNAGEDGHEIGDLEIEVEDLFGAGVEGAETSDGITRLIANVLNEPPLLGGPSALRGPGAQLSETDISKAIAFPSLTLPPGPADVPAHHDFFDLQIAFQPVWQEALDESVFGDVEALYENFVENGGEPQFFFEIVFTYNQHTSGGNATEPNVQVQKHFEIKNHEWAALSETQRAELIKISNEINKYMDFMKKKKLQGHKFNDGLSDGDLQAFNRARSYVLSIVGELRQQGERLVGIAQAELERQAAGRPLVPNNAILRQIRSRARSAYPAKYFAANRQQRSVNFGLMLNYRQRWTPVSYQVGELIRSIPLAPKEVRKYSKKIVKKQRRAQKEVENNLEMLKSETNSTTRAEADIVQKAMDKTNFNASANGSFSLGVWSGGGSSTLSQDAESQSSETKKRMHEAVVKAAREYRNETKVEIETESSVESEFQESGEIVNPNDELTVTYLFYELQRRYRVEERLHRMTSVVLVAQEMPNPGEIDEDWLIAHRWILNRVLLDDGFKAPLAYVAEGMVAAQFALEEMRKSLAQQRRLVEDLKEDISESRGLTDDRYSALQRSMERSARASQRKSGGGGLFGLAKKLTTVGVVSDLVGRFVGGENESPEAARVREAAAQDAYERELQKLRDLEAQLAQMNASLGRATEEFSARLAEHMSYLVQVSELRNHIKDNITHYMQAIWMHEPFQQRWLRLKDVPVPVLKTPMIGARKFKITTAAIQGALSNVVHTGKGVHSFETWPEVALPENPNGPVIETVPLFEVADIDDLIGFRANYMIFPMKKPNAITGFMMEPYVERAAGGFGIADPDDLGNMNLDEFAEYVCCLKKRLSDEQFKQLHPKLNAQLKILLQSPLRDDEEVVVPMDAAYIEALPGSTPILEDFKLLHRQIDAADALESLRMKKLEKIRYAQRLLMGKTDDPDADERYVFEGAAGGVNVQPGGADGGGGGP